MSLPISSPVNYKSMFDKVMDEMECESCGSTLFLTPSHVSVTYCPIRHLNWKKNGYRWKNSREFLRSNTI